MKKIKLICIILFTAVVLNSCATILAGSVSDCQRTKPLPGKPSREIRVGYLIADIIFSPIWAVDFLTGAIYRPCK
jgi:predicted small secreted protein